MNNHITQSYIDQLRELAQIRLEEARERSKLCSQHKKRPRSPSPAPESSSKKLKTTPPSTSLQYPNLEIPIPPRYPSPIPVPSRSLSPIPIYILSRSPSPPVFRTPITETNHVDIDSINLAFQNGYKKYELTRIRTTTTTTQYIVRKIRDNRRTARSESRKPKTKRGRGRRHPLRGDGRRENPINVESDDEDEIRGKGQQKED
jgi:hypothetical protein